jgi:hypothetical protein
MRRNEQTVLEQRYTMNNAQLRYDPAPQYRIEVQGAVDMDWLQSFDSSTEITDDKMAQVNDITVIHVHTDQSGVVGLIRRLHGLGLTILKLERTTRKEA